MSKALKLSQLYISIRNHSGAPASYYLVAVPTDAKNTNRLAHFTCVYQASLQVPSPNGSAVFPVTRHMVGVCGTGKRTLGEGLKLFASDWAAVKPGAASAPGTKLSMSLIMQKEAAFEPAAETATTEGDSKWAIDVTRSFTTGNARAPFVGYGLADPVNPLDVVPLCIWQAQPGVTYTMQSPQKWRVVQGSAEAHDIVLTEGGNKTDEISFEGTWATKAEVLHGSDGTLTVKYL